MHIVSVQVGQIDIAQINFQMIDAVNNLRIAELTAIDINQGDNFLAVELTHVGLQVSRIEAGVKLQFENLPLDHMALITQASPPLRHDKFRGRRIFPIAADRHVAQQWRNFGNVSGAQIEEINQLIRGCLSCRLGICVFIGGARELL